LASEVNVIITLIISDDQM